MAEQRTRWLRVREVADILQVSPKTVTRYAAGGKLPHARTIGGHRRYPEDQILALAEQLKVQVGEVRR